ncbi:Methyltransf-2 domain-containing protein [Mycena sanguinolenta]|uniref:Methyltransf-2 domain-containing protein n=1 Tax=Mycena sanguinolenta TaxID=230812 RepID=A0A8H6Y0G5_9AGAR|nr:Methyltransf-2 domain-containing protein [Mycena sanguinolenta]
MGWISSFRIETRHSTCARRSAVGRIPIVSGSITQISRAPQEDERVVETLRHLGDAAQPTTKLVVVDIILESAARVPHSGEEAIPGSTRLSAPAPLLPNWGVGKATVYYFDMHLLSVCRGRRLTAVVDALHDG